LGFPERSDETGAREALCASWEADSRAWRYVSRALVAIFNAWMGVSLSGCWAGTVAAGVGVGVGVDGMAKRGWAGAFRWNRDEKGIES